MGNLILLSIANWLHLLATVIWIGGMAIFSLVVIPGATQALGPGPSLGKLMGALVGKYKPLAYISMILLVISGVLMLVSNENFEGFGKFGGIWPKVMFTKHLIVLVMVIIGIYSAEGVARKINKLAAAAGASGASGVPRPPSPELAKLQKLQLNLIRINLILGVIVLLLTAITTAVSA